MFSGNNWRYSYILDFELSYTWQARLHTAILMRRDIDKFLSLNFL